MVKKLFRQIMAAVLSLLLICSNFSGIGSGSAAAASRLFEKTPAWSGTVDVVDCTKDSALGKMLGQVVEGLVNKSAAKVYLLFRQQHMDQLIDSGKTYQMLTLLNGDNPGFRTLFSKYKSVIQKMIVFDPSKAWTWNIAVMKAAQENGLPVTAELKDELISEFGWNGTVEDISNNWNSTISAYDWAKQNLLAGCSSECLFSLGLRSDWQTNPFTLYDYAIATKGFVCWLNGDDSTENTELASILADKDYPAGSTVLGYGPNGDDILKTVQNYGFGMIVSDFIANASFWSSFPNNTYSQYITKDLARGKSATASSIESSQYAAGNAVDDYGSSRWSSGFNRQGEWLKIDLGSVQKIDTVKIDWEAAYATSYSISVSSDDRTYTTVKNVTGASGGMTRDVFTALDARYIKINMTGYLSQYSNFSIYTVSAMYNQYDYSDLALFKTTSASTSDTGLDSYKAVDGFSASRWASAQARQGEWFKVDMGSSQTIDIVKIKWEAAYATNYSIAVSNDDSTYTTVKIINGAGGGITTDTFYPVTARYVKIMMTGYPGSMRNFSIYTLGVYFNQYAKPDQARGAVVTASTADTANGFTAENVTDGSDTTKWSSLTAKQGEWLKLDLKNIQAIDSVKIKWNTAYATDYDISVSSDDTNYVQVKSVTGATGGTTTDSFSAVNARYVKVTMTGYPGGMTNFSIYTLGVYFNQNAVTNLAVSKSVSASTSDTSNRFTADKAVDGNDSTRWASLTAKQGEWFKVDLGRTVLIDTLAIKWEAAYATAYSISVSRDDSTYTTVKNVTGASGGTTNDAFCPVNARYVKITMTGYTGNMTNFSIYTLGVYFNQNDVTDLALSKSASASTSDTANGFTADKTIDGNDLTRWSSLTAAQGEWYKIDLGAVQTFNTVKINWETAYATNFKILASSDNVSYKIIKTITDGTGGATSYTFSDCEARYIKIVMTGYCSPIMNFSIYSISVYDKFLLPETYQNHAVTSENIVNKQRLGKAVPAENGKIYVSIVLSDGDNASFIQNDTYSLWTTDPQRGTVPVGITIPPSLQEFNPVLLNWLYANKTQNDELVAGPSGYQFTYMSSYPSSLCSSWLNINRTWLNDAGLRISVPWRGNTSTLQSYTADSGLLGIFCYGTSISTQLINNVAAIDIRGAGEPLSEGDIYSFLSSVSPNSTGPVFRCLYPFCGNYGASDGKYDGYSKIKREIDRLNAAYPDRFVFLLPSDLAETIKEYYRTDLAKSATITTDSEDSLNGFTANKANDEDTSSCWSAADTGTGHWLKVDLGQSKTIHGAEMYWKDSGDYLYKIETSTDNTNWTTAVNKTGSTNGNQIQADSFNATARYVRITVTGMPSGKRASLWEFKVF